MSLTDLEEWKRVSIEKHTRVFDPPVQASDGLVSKYIDGIGMLLCARHLECEQWSGWLFAQAGPAYRALYIGMGQSGATILGVLGQGTLISPSYKPHGLEFSGELPRPGSQVVIFDDVAVTGQSIASIREWCERHELRVIKEVIMVDKRTGGASA